MRLKNLCLTLLLMAVTTGTAIAGQCECLYYPMMPYGGDLYFFYAGVMDNSPSPCTFQYPTGVLCTLNDCSSYPQACTGGGSSGTCSTLGPKTKLETVAKTPNKFERSTLAPYTANVRDELSEKIDGEDHREKFVAEGDPKYLRIIRKTSSGTDHMFVKVQTLKRDSVQIEFGVEIERPDAITPVDIENDDCVRLYTTVDFNGLPTEIPIPGGLLVKAAGKIYLVRLSGSEENRYSKAFPTRNIGKFPLTDLGK